MGLNSFIHSFYRNVSHISSTCLLLIDHFLLFYVVEMHYDSMLNLSYLVHQSILYLSILDYSCFLSILHLMVDYCCITCGGLNGLGKMSTLWMLVCFQHDGCMTLILINLYSRYSLSCFLECGVIGMIVSCCYSQKTCYIEYSVDYADWLWMILDLNISMSSSYIIYFCYYIIVNVWVWIG